MAWHVIYNSTTGAAVSICETPDLPPPATLTAKGLAVFDAIGDARVGVWNATTRTMETAPLPPLRVATDKFIKAFPDAKWLALRNAAANNGTLMKFYDRVMAREEINVRDPDVTQGFAMLEAGGLLTPAEAAAIKTALGV
jgi:hypothetical protein